MFAGHLPSIPHPWIPAFAGMTMALRRPHKRMKIAGCRGSLAGKTLRRYGVPHPWTPAPYLGTGHAFDRRSDELGVYFHSNDGTGKSNGSRLFSYKYAECGPSGSGLAIMISGRSGSRH